ncbi:UDP-glucose 4-epimerase GalE [Mucilaginibacter sp. X5P1]|uniref:UDP-glucose 4-epimerase GalE n=1 Tax=Mucilaginibacter sp. X5P1 TaxID=2723088 RepID=UPI001612CB21|nr:UDP-glucose 4-epimerase GalE [Mucilaginibacter sp. X5P1]MBB6141671.1 UDP-glucose 4-epimerase [Mucilaginibacter sp. X5P1]
MKSKILVTGGAGYIGSHTVVELVNAGYTPIIVDSLQNSNSLIIQQVEKITGVKIEFHQIDLCESEEIERLITNNPDIQDVIHFAAFKAVNESVSFPLKYYRNNLYSLINVLEAFKGRHVNLVFSSSCTVYGQPDQLPVSESATIKKAESPYGNTKQIAEEILEDLASVDKNFNITSLRYFNPVGAHPSAMIGELPNGTPQNLFPYITQSATGRRGLKELTVYGDDYNTPDGSCIRDFIHVVDLAKAHVVALEFMKNNHQTNYNVFNIGTGRGYSVLEVIKEFEELTGVKLNYKIGQRRSGDIEKIFSDVKKSSKVLKWKAENGLKEMIQSAWAWENI